MQYAIKDEGDIRKYFTMVPNMIDDSGLSPFAYRLYGHLKRVAGDNGRCYQSVRTLATACKMGTSSVTKARRELEEGGYIRCNSVPSDHGGLPTIEIEIVDIWMENGIKYTSTRDETASTRSETPSTRDALASTRGAIKEKPIKKNSLRKTTKEEVTAVAFAHSSFQDNRERDCLELYTLTTNQPAPPSDQVDRILADMSTILEYYGTVEAAVPEGQRIFARWCSTRGKSGKTYARTNSAWLGWWLDEIAPRPEKQELSVTERLARDLGVNL